ncbi:hypothetical protein OF83DRAFT_1043449, partial [Amylostereum chailletii]
VQQWTRGHFKGAWLRDGVFISLGHEGKPCPLQEPHMSILSKDNDFEDDDTPSPATDPMEPGPQDSLGNQMMILVHSTGVHQMSVHFCQCDGAASADLQLLALGLYSASIKTPKTAFTFSVLDDASDENLNSNVTIGGFYNR